MNAVTKSRKPRISPGGLWLLIVYKTNDLRYPRLEDLPDDRDLVEQNLNKIIENVRTEKDLDELLRLIDEVADGDAIETLERIAMHY